MQKRDNSIDILRGIGIILMIMGHSSFGDTFECYKQAFNMGIFFFFSGYFFKISPFWAFLKRKTKTILVPFISFAAITIIVCICTNIISGEPIYSLKNLILGLVYSNRNIFPITGAIWFLQCLFILEILFWVLIKYLDIVYVSFLVLFLYGIGTFLPAAGVILPFSLDSALGATATFFAGYCLKNMKQQQVKSAIRPWAVLPLFALNVFMIFLNGNVNPRTCTYGNPVLYLFNSLLAIYIYWIISKELDKKSKGLLCSIKKALSNIGRNSIVYLGLNQLIIKGFLICFAFFDLSNNSAVKIFRSIVCVVITTGIIHIISGVLNNTKLKVLIGK